MKMFKNKISKWMIGACLLAVTATSCKDSFLEKIPTGSVAPETVFSNMDNAYATINGLHRSLYRQWYSVQAEGGQSGNMIYMEVLGDDFVMTGAANGWFNNEYKWQQNHNANSNMVRFNYGFYYSLIGNANQIIANIDDTPGSELDRNFIKAQALTYRAWSYFQMVQLYGKRYVAGGDNSSMGMSIILEPSADVVPRSSVEDTYRVINEDLNDAIELFANARQRPNNSHLNIDVAKGIKARVALTQQNWPDAAKFAREARQGYRLMNEEEYLSGFSNFNLPESMWGFNHRDDQPTYFYSFYAYVGNFSSTNTRGNPKAINSLLYARIPSTDVRKQLWDSTGADPDFPVAANGVRRPYMNAKFLLENPGNSNGDLMLMRSAEMILIEAEALARMGGRDADAQDVIFELVSTRDPSATKTTKTGDDLIEHILTQRRIELWGEGFRFYDLKRLNLPLNRNGANHNATLAVTFDVPAGDVRWQFLIPQAELNRTQGVVIQNPTSN